MSSADAVREWLRLRRDVELQEAVLKESKRLRDDAERDALAAFEAEGCQSVRLDDGTLVSLKRTIRASVRAGRGDDAVAALYSLGLDDLVGSTIHAQTLSAYVREQEQAGQPLPQELGDLINVAEMFSLSARRRV